MTTLFLVTIVSTATLLFGSLLSAASTMASDIWSQILSGCPAATDSDVNCLYIQRSFLSSCESIGNRPGSKHTPEGVFIGFSFDKLRTIAHNLRQDESFPLGPGWSTLRVSSGLLCGSQSQHFSRNSRFFIYLYFHSITAETCDQL